jgi:hypothetical protein
MKRRVSLILGGVSLLTGCGPRDEFPHQTVEAYQADSAMRARTLQTCAGHITSKTPFKNESDTDECRKALAADQNVRLAEHNAREAAASRAALASAARQFEGH